MPNGSVHQSAHGYGFVDFRGPPPPVMRRAIQNHHVIRHLSAARPVKSRIRTPQRVSGRFSGVRTV